MCRPLTVTCLRRVAGIDICDHYFTFSDLKIPCKNPDSQECRDGKAELVDFQNPSTLCAGRIDGLYLDADERGKRCVKALEKYGQSLHRVNLEGPGTVSWWKRKSAKKGEEVGAAKSKESSKDF
ncbi:hypothetical protein M409DRAFT_18235 [Zasmidium cellare ATCC 36951]|uniref:Uncharacterized protein n=1 Tax=Zasmidium cellare ATCC 36951 TaxID=1080233 RepID=A0A6A6CXV2_ZASCE|nr:uncharacterized protein M409DRAFT_18235 [Zasmidium cellare ATCC 36951]KAF2172004.1 hypothetical protein M409DRAFT_18235 [Zasmidium cellare ATCC 36951]